jgi:hypothetical protein
VGRGERSQPGSSSSCTAAPDDLGETVAGYSPGAGRSRTRAWALGSPGQEIGRLVPERRAASGPGGSPRCSIGMIFRVAEISPINTPKGDTRHRLVRVEPGQPTKLLGNSSPEVRVRPLSASDQTEFSAPKADVSRVALACWWFRPHPAAGKRHLLTPCNFSSPGDERNRQQKRHHQPYSVCDAHGR